MLDEDGNVITVHPLAAWPPMLSGDEMAALAEDIRENGLLLPIVVDEDGTLIDGRNRKRACEIAGVEPRYEKLNGHDPEALIVSSNLRRDMTKGQKAMFLARAYPEPDKAGRGNKGKASETDGFSQSRLKAARSVLRHSLALAEDVMSGRTALDAALAKVQCEREAAVSAEAQLAELRRCAPDLAEMVEDERLTLSDATAALRQRQEGAAKREDSVRKTLLRVSEGASSMVALANEEFVEELLERLDDEEFSEQWISRVRLDHERIGEVKAGANAFAKVLKHLASAQRARSEQRLGAVGQRRR